MRPFVLSLGMVALAACAAFPWAAGVLWPCAGCLLAAGCLRLTCSGTGEGGRWVDLRACGRVVLSWRLRRPPP